MFPPAQGVPLDTTRGYALELPCTPHIIVAPSNLAPFAKAMPLEQATLGQESDTAVTEEPSSVICINPGRLTKGANPGTFVQMSVAPQAGPVDRRCRVEIRKL